MLYPLHWLLSLLSSVLRLGAGRGGTQAETNRAVPVLYEFEGCPYCKIAREAISEAGVSVLVRPCPKGGTRFRPRVAELGGKTQFPYLVDTDTGEGMYESGDVARAMREQAGTRRALVHWLGPLNVILSQYSILFRLLAGVRVRPAKVNDAPLEFCGTEASPAARLVKERLCEMELEYIWRPGTGDGVRLFDPNTGEHLSGARSALAHLTRVYRPEK